MSYLNSDSFIKELNDVKVIDEGVSAIDRAVINEVIPHFIYCGNHYSTTKEAQYELQKMFLEKMRKHGVQSAMLTLMSLSRSHLVTKEKVKKAYKENFIYPRPINKLGKIVKLEQSIHEDLETLFQNLQNQVNVKKINVKRVNRNKAPFSPRDLYLKTPSFVKRNTKVGAPLPEKCKIKKPQVLYFLFQILGQPPLLYFAFTKLGAN